jgi:hypothetical protein
MKHEKIFSIFFTILLILSLLFLKESRPGENGIEIRTTSPLIIETLPGKTVSGNFLVINHRLQEEHLIEEIKLPQGFTLITQEEPSFSLEPTERDIRVFGISIPPITPPGLNEIKISVRSEKDHSVSDEKSINIKVLPFYRISLSIEEKPERAISGQTYTVRAKLLNYGNLKIKVKLELKIHPEARFTIDPSNILEIEEGASHPFSISVKIDENLKRKERQVLRILASVEGIEEKVLTEESFSLEIIPRIAGKEDLYHRIPSTLTLNGFYENTDKPLGKQIELSGAGSMDENGEKRVAFKFRGPKNEKRRYFYDKEVYMLSFDTRDLRIHLGDGYYNLTPLVGPSVTERGARVSYQTNLMEIKGVFSTPIEKWYRRDFTIGGGLTYKASEILKGGLNVLRYNFEDESYSHLIGLEGGVKFDRLLKLEFEGVILENKETPNDYAWRVGLSGEPIKKLKYFFKHSHVGSYFPEGYSQGDLWTGGLTLPLFDKVTGEFSFSKWKEELDKRSSEERTTRSDEFFMSGGISWTSPLKAVFSLQYRLYDRKDILEPTDYDFRDQLLRISAQKNILLWKMNGYLNGYVEGGLTDDRQSNQKKHLINSGLSGTISPSGWQSYTLFFNYGRDYLSDSAQKIYSLGIIGDFKLTKRLSFNLSYFINHRYYEREDEDKFNYLRHTLRGRAAYLLPNNHSIRLNGQYVKAKEEEKPEISVSLSYTIPLGIPASKKKSVGTIKGVVYDEEDPKKTPLRDVILLASGIPAVTNKEGRFVLPGLKPGEYFLQVERGSIGHNRTTSEKLQPIIIKGGDLTNLSVGIIKSSRIYGKVLLFTPKREFITEETTKEEDFIPSGGIGDVLIEISRKGEVLRQFTDIRGEFFFEDVRPGVWKVKIYEESLPPLCFIKEKEFELELKPSKEKELKIEVFKKPRKVMMIED